MLIELPVYHADGASVPYLFNTEYIRMVKPLFPSDARLFACGMNASRCDDGKAEYVAKHCCMLYMVNADAIIIHYDFETISKMLAGK